MLRVGDWKRWGALALRLGIGGLFGYAGVQKLVAPTTFAEQIANYHLWPEWAPWAAATLPAVEIVTATALVLAPRPWRVGAAAAIAGMLLFFTSALTRAWALDLNLDCGCFGQGSSPIGLWPIARNLTLVLLLIGLVRWEQWGMVAASAPSDASDRGRRKSIG
jgi:putative oxidoreductase